MGKGNSAVAPSDNGNVAVLDEPVTPLLQISLDDIESIEADMTELPPADSESAPDGVQEELPFDTEEQILSTVESFDVLFAKDPLRAEWLAWGQRIKDDLDSVDRAVQYYTYGKGLDDLMRKEKALSPKNYERSKTLKKGATVLSLLGVPEYLIRPSELVHAYWVVRLDNSTVGTDHAESALGDGAAGGSPEAELIRTFQNVTDEWFGGNITMSAVRSLEKAIDRASKPKKGDPDNELDVWDYRKGYEDWSRDKVTRLRKGELSVRQVDSLFAAKKKHLEESARRAKYAGLTKDEIAGREAQAKNKTIQVQLNKAAEKALDLAEFASEHLNKGSADLKQFLVDRQIIPTEKRLSAAEYAATMTGGDAKVIVQTLVAMWKNGDATKANVFKALYAECKAVVDELQAMQGTRKAS